MARNGRFAGSWREQIGISQLVKARVFLRLGDCKKGVIFQRILARNGAGVREYAEIWSEARNFERCSEREEGGWVWRVHEGG